jgi:hypothetical protein
MEGSGHALGLDRHEVPGLFLGREKGFGLIGGYAVDVRRGHTVSVGRGHSDGIGRRGHTVSVGRGHSVGVCRGRSHCRCG